MSAEPEVCSPGSLETATSWFAFCYCDRTLTQSSLRRTSFIWLSFISHHQEKPGQVLKERKQEPWRKAASWLTSHPRLSLLSCTTHDHLRYCAQCTGLSHSNQKASKFSTDMPSGQADGGRSSTEALPSQVTLVYQIVRNKLTSTGSDPPCRQPRVCTIVRTGGRLRTYVVIVLRFLKLPLSMLGLSVKNVIEDLGQLSVKGKMSPGVE